MVTHLTLSMWMEIELNMVVQDSELGLGCGFSVGLIFVGMGLVHTERNK